MKKRLLAIALMVVLLVSLLAGSIPAAFAAENAENAKFLVGYSKQDVNPWVKSDYTGDLGIEDKTYTPDSTYPSNGIIEVALTDGVQKQKMVSVPLAGYSSAMKRFSDTLVDDNGDGTVGLGDGIFTTCTAVSDEQGTTVLFVTLDGIGAFDKLLEKIRPAIVDALNGAVEADKIMFSTSHSHEGPDFDNIFKYMKTGTAWEAYFNYAVDQITKAATEAYNNRAAATMTKGEVDAKDATAAMGKNDGKGYEMNTVRHYYMVNGYKSSRTFIGAGEFNNFSNLIKNAAGNKVEYKGGTSYESPVAEANDTMYLLQFTPDVKTEDQKPIVLVNWRAHPSALGGETATIISADYINALRYGLEQKDYFVGFFQGASGNINPRAVARDSQGWHKYEADYVKDVSGTAAAAEHNTNIYGRLLAEVALYGLENSMTKALDSSVIKTVYHGFDTMKTDGTTYKQPINVIALGKETMIVVGAGEYFDRYDANYKDHYQATYEKYARVKNGWKYEDVWTETSINTYDLPQLKYKSNDGKGDQNFDVSGYTYNQWNTLVGDFYGTPFFFGYSSTRNGYVPNTMAYEYNTGLTGDYAYTPEFDDGTEKKAFSQVSYEVTSSNQMAKGEGEKIIAKMAEMVQTLSHEMTTSYEIVNADGSTTAFDTIQDAVNAYTAGGSNYIKLYRDLTEDISVAKDVYMDLNGKQVTGNITIEEGKTLYCMDSFTDDYDVKDGKGYAVISGTVTGNLQGVPEGSLVSPNERPEGFTPYHAGYLKIVEGNKISFHRVDLGLMYTNFKPADVGISYTSNFSADQVVAAHVDHFGVAVSLVEAPNAKNLKKVCGYTTLKGFAAGDAVNASKSTRLVNIMRETNENAINQRNAERTVYGSAYLKLDTGYVFGASVAKTLKETVEAVNDQFREDTNVQLKGNTVKMFKTFGELMTQWNWDVANIKAIADQENAVKKILVVGNSHGVDSTEMLGKIYMAENPDQKVQLGRLYHSGCRLDQHVDFLTNNAGQYIYYKTNANGVWDRAPMSLPAVEDPITGNVADGTTMYDALVDDTWDIIIMQTGANNSGLEADYNSDIQTIQNYIIKTLGYTPEFYWHMSWAHPVEDIEGDKFVTVNTSSQFKDYYGGDQMTMYNAIANAVKNKILPDKSFKAIMPTGTAIQNANSSYLRDADLYRDYTHTSDLGRLIAGYTWYCTLEGVQLDEIKLTTVTRDVLKSYITAGGEGNMVLTANEAAIVAESVKNALNNPFAVTQSVYTTK